LRDGRAAELLGHLVEGAGEVADLVRGADLEAEVPAPAPDAPRGIGEGAERAGDRVRDQDPDDEREPDGEEDGDEEELVGAAEVAAGGRRLGVDRETGRAAVARERGQERLLDVRLDELVEEGAGARRLRRRALDEAVDLLAVDAEPTAEAIELGEVAVGRGDVGGAAPAFGAGAGANGDGASLREVLVEATEVGEEIGDG